MKFDLKFFGLGLATVVALLGAYYFQSQISSLRQTIQQNHEEMAGKIAILEMKKSHDRTIVVPAISQPQGLKAQVFQFLYAINSKKIAGKNPEDASTPKRIRYLPNELLIQDLSVAQEDAFFDLLSVLLDKDAISGIEVSVPKIRRALLDFGVRSEQISRNSDGKFRIRLVEALDTL
jgi:hypothetical protein